MAWYPTQFTVSGLLSVSPGCTLSLSVTFLTPSIQGGPLTHRFGAVLPSGLARV